MRPHGCFASQRSLCSIVAVLLSSFRQSEAIFIHRQSEARALSREHAGSMDGVSYRMQVKPSGGAVTVQMKLSNASLVLEVDHLNEAASFTGNGAVLTHAQKAKLFSLHRWRAMKYGVKDLIARLAGYTAEAPTDHAFHLHRVRGGQFRLACLSQGEEAHAVWTDSNNTLHNVTVTVGSAAGPNYGCMGRCGKGCPKHNKTVVIYTQNCLNHDQCSYESRSQKGMRDKECGEEYKRAMPDYLWGDKTCKRRQRAKHDLMGLMDGLNASDYDDGSQEGLSAENDGSNYSSEEDGSEADENRTSDEVAEDEDQEVTVDDGAEEEGLQEESTDQEEDEDVKKIKKEDLAHMIDDVNKDN